MQTNIKSLYHPPQASIPPHWSHGSIRPFKTNQQVLNPLYEKIENITYFKQSASFIKPHTLKVGNETLYGEKIVIAAGARPKIPQIPGLKDTPFWTSTDALQSTHIPKSMVILGGGYIACELGYYLQRMGASVTYCARTELIRQEDEDIKEVFNQQVSTYARIINHTTPTHISHDGEQFTITLPNETLVSEGLLVATGVTPYSDTLALENTDIETDEHGFIKVNDHLETNTKNHYAFGDIIGRYLFRHNANFEGDYLFNNTIKEETKKPIVYPPMPHAVFTYPQVAGVGLKERDCIEQGIDIVVGKNQYKQSAMGMALRSDHGFVKVIFDKHTDRLIGAHIIGHEASSLIHMLITAMHLKATRTQLLSMIYVHPALPEIIRNAIRSCP